MIFVDTSAWFALYSLRDANHNAATQAFRLVREPLVTTDYVVSETLTLLRARNESRRAIAFGNRLIESGGAKIERIDDADFAAAWSTFRQFADKRWSFTDCASRVVMHRLGIQHALTFDDHFRQFGTVTVMP